MNRARTDTSRVDRRRQGMDIKVGVDTRMHHRWEGERGGGDMFGTG
jgi:hypothetical protein